MVYDLLRAGADIEWLWLLDAPEHVKMRYPLIINGYFVAPKYAGNPQEVANSFDRLDPEEDAGEGWALQLYLTFLNVPTLKGSTEDDMPLPVTAKSHGDAIRKELNNLCRNLAAFVETRTLDPVTRVPERWIGFSGGPMEN